jgi:hypothetical protein
MSGCISARSQWKLLTARRARYPARMRRPQPLEDAQAEHTLVSYWLLSLGFYTHVDVGDVPDVSEGHVASISKPEVCKMGVCVYTGSCFEKQRCEDGQARLLRGLAQWGQWTGKAVQPAL